MVFLERVPMSTVEAEAVLYELWYSIAETLFQRVCDATNLNEEQREALRSVALRPNDFQLRVGP